MLITLSRRTANCQSVAEVYLTGMAPFGAQTHRFFLNLMLFSKYYLKNITDNSEVTSLPTNLEVSCRGIFVY